MAQFNVNTSRIDPYQNFNFRLKWDNQYVAACSKMSALKRTTKVVEHRAGGDATTQRKNPGLTSYEAITLERGITLDLVFHDWAGLVWNYGSQFGSLVSLANFRKNITAEMYNEAGQKVMSILLYRCWVSEYQAWPDMDANNAAIAIEHIKIEHEGFARDTSIVELAEPTLTTVNT